MGKPQAKNRNRVLFFYKLHVYEAGRILSDKEVDEIAIINGYSGFDSFIKAQANGTHLVINRKTGLKAGG